MKTSLILLLLSLPFLLQSQESEAVLHVNLNQNWTLNVLDGPGKASSIMNKNLEVSLPTTLHLDLLKNKLIEDPFYGANYQTVEWVSDCTIKYSKVFSVNENLLQKQEAELVFGGIDTYATILLNGQKIEKTENAFREYVINIKGKLKNDNRLEVLIEPTKQFDEKGQKEDNMPFKYAHTRKACYQYSWDWAPYLNTLGIWKDVSLRLYGNIRIDYVWARNKLLSNEQAIVNFAVQFTTNPYGDQLKSGYTFGVFLEDQKLNEVNVTEKEAYLDISIKKPELWWPNGIGTPYIYDFVVKVMKDKKVVQQKKMPYGLRSVELNLQNKQFQVKVNGYAIYCKGANYVPPDMFYPRITNPVHQPKNSLEKLVNDAVESNFNMLRIWGGGQYESDELLQLASRKGIMLFYDFMFSDSIYPSTEHFLMNVEEEIKQQVRRARNYPALVLWCGNNQILQGIQDWGWGRSNYKSDYKKLFETLIKKVVDIESPSIPYIPSSPIYGVGNYGFDRGGDFHYWGVWAGGSPFEGYETAIGPFNSEFGTQSLPVFETVKSFAPDWEKGYQSNSMRVHERHGSQFSTLINYMKMYAKASENFEKEIYLSGLVQAFGIEIAIKAQRASKPKSYGTLYWQFNDAWPAISWSSIDYYGRWKPLQYMAKRLYPNLAVFCFKNFKVFAINDNLFDIETSVKVSIISFEGEMIFNQTQTVHLKADSTKEVLLIDRTLIQGRQAEVVVYCQIDKDNKRQMTSTFFLKAFKDLKLPQATLSVTYDLEKNQISLKSDKLIKSLYISSRREYIKLSDNYIDLLPNIEKKVCLEGGKLADLKSTLKYMSMREASVAEELGVEVH